MEGYTTQGPRRTGYIFAPGGEPTEITYEVQGGLAIWEGDIVLGRADQVPATRAELMARPQRGSYISGSGYRWPGGVMPYQIDAGLTTPSRVTQAIQWIETQTPGVTVVPFSGQSDYVKFVDGSGCSSPVGRQGGEQDITLGSGCGVGNAAHEMLHSLGMNHEQSRCDRDDYVIIHMENVQSGYEGNFDKLCPPDNLTYDTYDPGSIMHYPPTAFSKNGLNTIEAKPGVDASQMGQRGALGPTDVSTIAYLYGSNNVAPTAVIGSLASSYDEGSPVPFDGTGSSDPDDPTITWSWLFGDGACAVPTPPAACSMAAPSHTYADNGSFSVSLTVSDGFLDNTAATSVTIDNVAPAVSAGSDGTVDEGSPFHRSGSFTDPGADTWGATVDYGEGGGSENLPLAGKTFSLSHSYVDNGSYTIAVSVSDDDGGTGTDDVQVTVENVAPTVDAGPDASLTSGETFDFSGSFSDPGVDDDPWDWVITWGDGEPNATGSTNDQSAAIEASHQVCAAGAYTVTLAVTDKDGGTGSDGLTVTVPYLAIGIDISPTDLPNPVNLNKKGVLAVAVLGSATFDATAIDPASLTLGDEALTDTHVVLKNNGTYQTSLEDVNGDGIMDMVAKFDIPTLVANGDLTSASTSLVLRGFLADGCTNFRGEDVVTVVP